MKVVISKEEVCPVYVVFKLVRGQDTCLFQGLYDTVIEVSDDLLIKFDKIQQEWDALQTELSNLFCKNKETQDLMIKSNQLF
jgi:hypothetical protein